MESKIVRIGNSNGVIIPSSFLQELGLNVGSLLNITISKMKGELVIKRQTARSGWSNAFKEYAKDPDDLVFADFSEEEIVD